MIHCTEDVKSVNSLCMKLRECASDHMNSILVVISITVSFISRQGIICFLPKLNTLQPRSVMARVVLPKTHTFMKNYKVLSNTDNILRQSCSV